MNLVIEDTCDFNKLLYSIVNEENIDESDICLISQEKLERDYITLECGHKFNYSSIFECVYREKVEDVNKFENIKLRANQIRCPYCRSIQDKLLPPCDGYKSIRYVNYPVAYCMETQKCIYTYKSGAKKDTQCNTLCSYNKSYCKKHSKHNEKKKGSKCKFILVKGKNKGKECGHTAYKDFLCKRHYY